MRNALSLPLSLSLSLSLFLSSLLLHNSGMVYYQNRFYLLHNQSMWSQGTDQYCWLGVFSGKDLDIPQERCGYLASVERMTRLHGLTGAVYSSTYNVVEYETMRANIACVGWMVQCTCCGVELWVKTTTYYYYYYIYRHIYLNLSKSTQSATEGWKLKALKPAANGHYLHYMHAWYCASIGQCFVY